MQVQRPQPAWLNVRAEGLLHDPHTWQLWLGLVRRQSRCAAAVSCSVLRRWPQTASGVARIRQPLDLDSWLCCVEHSTKVFQCWSCRTEFSPMQIADRLASMPLGMV